MVNFDVIINIFRIIFGLIMIFFIPGYAGTWALYPRKEEILFFERIALAFGLSIATAILCSIGLDIVLGVDTTGLNIVVSLLLITSSSAVIWMYRIIFSDSIKQLRIKVSIAFTSLKHKLHMK